MPEYSDDEAEEILRRALSREKRQGISHDDLVAAASEVGVARADVEAAAEEIARERIQLARTAQLKQALRRRFVGFSANMLAANALIVGIDYLTGPGWWFQWVALATGFVLVTRGARALSPNREDLERAEYRLSRRERRAQRRAEKATRRELRQSEKRRPKRAEAEFERVVEQGVEALLRTAADRIERFNTQATNASPRVRVEPEAGHDESDGPSQQRSVNPRRGRR